MIAPEIVMMALVTTGASGPNAFMATAIIVGHMMAMNSPVKGRTQMPFLPSAKPIR